ncbi:hypothetical protein, partial [Aquisphaera insulae]|uniref:hypothetical protein n=1 Tax=Aquisphaera insulae TaxID=2712864 RepID=UPI0013EA7D6C
MTETAEGHLLGDDLSMPLRVKRSGRSVPDIFKPGISLVVSEVVRQKLLEVRHIEFQKVEFSKLIDMPYKAGDMAFYESEAFLADPVGMDPENLLDRLPNVPSMHSHVGNFYEVIVPRLSEVSGGFPDEEAEDFVVKSDDHFLFDHIFR